MSRPSLSQTARGSKSAFTLDPKVLTCLSRPSKSASRLHQMTTDGHLRTEARRRDYGMVTSASNEGASKGFFEAQKEQQELEELNPSAAASQIEHENKPKSIWGKIKYFFVGEKLDRKRLAALGGSGWDAFQVDFNAGLGAVASYGFVSNATYGTGMAVSWIAFVKKTGKSPLMAGQWKPFLAFFAGFWTVQNFLRPLRLTLALGMAPAFDKILNFLQQRTGLSKRNAFGLYLVGFGSLTCFFVFGSIYLFAGSLAFSRYA